MRFFFLAAIVLTIVGAVIVNNAPWVRLRANRLTYLHPYPLRRWPIPSAAAIERFSTRSSEWAGSTTAFIISLAVVLAWLATGPLFAFSDTWQLVINTITSVATFVMVFLIQRAQNKDSLAMHLKLSELIAAVRGSADRMMVVEELTEAELRQLHAHYLELVQARKTDETTRS